MPERGGEERAGRVEDTNECRVIYDRRTAARVKGKLYRTVVRPAVMDGFGDSGAFHWERQIRNECIRGRAESETLRLETDFCP